MKKLFCFLLILILGFYTSSRPVKAEETVYRVVAGTFPPFRYINEKGLHAGIDYEIVNAAFDVMGKKLSFEFLPFLRALNQVEQGEALGIAALTINEERKGFMTFSKPISYVRDVFFARKALLLKGWSDFDELQPFRIGRAKGYNYHQSFKNFSFANAVEVVHGQEGPEVAMIKMLAFDRLDLMICEYTVCRYILKNDPTFASNIESLEGNIGPVRPFHIGFSKAFAGADALRQEFDQALDVLKKNGTIAAIYGRYGLKTPQ